MQYDDFSADDLYLEPVVEMSSDGMADALAIAQPVPVQVKVVICESHC